MSKKKRHKHIHIKILFTIFVVFLFFISSLQLDPTMGKGSTQNKKFTEGGYMSIGETMKGSIMMSSGNGRDVLDMTEYQKTYVEKIQVVLDNMNDASTPSSVSLYQLVFYISLLKETPCTAMEVETELCTDSEVKEVYLKDEMKMQQAYYSMESERPPTFPLYAVELTVGKIIGDITLKSSLLPLIYSAAYGSGSISWENIRTAFEEKDVALAGDVYVDGKVTGKEVKNAVDALIKGLL